MEVITVGLEIVLMVVVVGSAAIGAAIKIVLIEYNGVKELWKQVLPPHGKKANNND